MVAVCWSYEYFRIGLAETRCAEFVDGLVSHDVFFQIEPGVFTVAACTGNFESESETPFLESLVVLMLCVLGFVASSGV